MQVFSEMLKISESEQILIDKKTNVATFPSRVQVVNDELLFNEKTKGAVYVISEALKKSQTKTAKLHYDKKTDNYEIYFEGVVCVNKTESEFTSDIEHLLELLSKKVKSVYFCSIDYDLNGNYFHNATGKIDVEKIIYNFGIRAFKDSIKERVALMKTANDFNKKLSGIKRFTFNFGNAFGGIKKLAILFGEELKIKANSGKRSELIPNKEEIIRELSLFGFSAWQSKYDKNTKPIIENAWTIELVLENETLEFTGLDDYPKTWAIVEYFIKKYGNFDQIKE